MIGDIGHAYICSKSMPCIAGLLLLSNCPLQELSADRQYNVPTGTVFWPIASRAADGHYKQPVGISSSRWYFSVCMEGVLGLWQFSERQGSENRGSSVRVRLFRARQIEHASFAHPKAGLRPHFFYLFDLILIDRKSVV